MRRTAGAFLLALGSLLAIWALARALLKEPASSSAAPVGSVAQLAQPRADRLANPDAVSEGSPSAAGAEGGRQDAEGPRLIGFVRSELDGAPVPDAWATLLAPLSDDGVLRPTVLAEIGTDAAGRFALPWPSEPATTVSVEAPYGWVLTGPSSAPAPLRHPAAPLEFRARRLRNAPLEVAVFDERTDEPVAFYVIGLRRGAMTSQLVLTDERGLGRSELPLDEGAYKVSLIDEPGMERVGGTLDPAIQFEALEGAQPCELRIPVGPTYLLDVRGPSGLDPRTLFAYLAREEGSLELTDVLERSRLRSEPLAGWPWVRFHARWVRGVLDGSEEVVLVVGDQARTLHGEARVPARWGIQRDPVRVDLRPTGALELQLRDPAGRPIRAAEVWIASHPEGRPETLRSSPEGQVRCAGLPARTYALHVQHVDFEPVESSAEVAPSRTTTRQIVLQPARVAGTVEGRVIGGSRVAGEPGFAARIRVSLSAIDGNERLFQLPLEFERRGESLVAAFRFDDVPAGEYVIGLANSNVSTWWPHNQLVRPPAKGLEIREVEMGTLAWVLPRAVDPQSGEDLAASWLWLELEGCRARLQPLAGYFPFQVHPEGPLQWGVGAQGRLPRFGTEADFELAEGCLTAAVPLEPGWGIRLDVSGAGGEPLEGAEVFVDGERAGATDALGSYLLQRAAAPASLEVRYRGTALPEGALEALLSGKPVWAQRLDAN